MSDRLGIGIIGLRMGYAQFTQLKDMPDVDLVAVCDLDETVVRRAERDFEVPLATTEYREVVEHPDVDIVSVATPDYLHVEQSVAALENGKQVMVEKPMARTVEECEAMIAAGREADTAYRWR